MMHCSARAGIGVVVQDQTALITQAVAVGEDVFIHRAVLVPEWLVFLERVRRFQSSYSLSLVLHDWYGSSSGLVRESESLMTSGWCGAS